jgi:hypothetical protein
LATIVIQCQPQEVFFAENIRLVVVESLNSLFATEDIMTSTVTVFYAQVLNTALEVLRQELVLLVMLVSIKEQQLQNLTIRYVSQVSIVRQALQFLCVAQQARIQLNLELNKNQIVLVANQDISARPGVVSLIKNALKVITAPSILTKQCLALSELTTMRLQYLLLLLVYHVLKATSARLRESPTTKSVLALLAISAAESLSLQYLVRLELTTI